MVDVTDFGRPWSWSGGGGHKHPTPPNTSNPVAIVDTVQADGRLPRYPLPPPSNATQPECAPPPFRSHIGVRHDVVDARPTGRPAVERLLTTRQVSLLKVPTYYQLTQVALCSLRQSTCQYQPCCLLRTVAAPSALQCPAPWCLFFSDTVASHWLPGITLNRSDRGTLPPSCGLDAGNPLA
jgi:hypothetical protein